MHIQFHEPWKKGMSITYSDILKTFSKTCEQHKQLEVELRKQIDIFIGEFKDSLAMQTPSYFEPGSACFFGEREDYDRKPKVSAELGYVERHSISGVGVDPLPVPCIPFTLKLVIGGDSKGDPFTSLDTEVKLGKSEGLLVVLVGEKHFTLPETNNIPQFNEVCEYIKMQLNHRCKG